MIIIIGLIGIFVMMSAYFLEIFVFQTEDDLLKNLLKVELVHTYTHFLLSNSMFMNEPHAIQK